MLPQRALVYLDSNILIHIIEGHPQLWSSVQVLVDLIKRHEISVATSELTLAETLVKPIAVANSALQAQYEAILNSSPELSVLPITRPILISAAKLRGACNSLKLPDAIHVATATSFGASHFLTEDIRIKLPPNISRVGLAQLLTP